MNKESRTCGKQGSDYPSSVPCSSVPVPLFLFLCSMSLLLGRMSLLFSQMSLLFAQMSLLLLRRRIRHKQAPAPTCFRMFLTSRLFFCIFNKRLLEREITAFFYLFIPCKDNLSPIERWWPQFIIRGLHTLIFAILICKNNPVLTFSYVFLRFLTFPYNPGSTTVRPRFDRASGIV
jgi:hypothetical protein